MVIESDLGEPSIIRVIYLIFYIKDCNSHFNKWKHREINLSILRIFKYLWYFLSLRVLTYNKSLIFCFHLDHDLFF